MLFTRKKNLIKKTGRSWDIFKEASKCVCTSTVVVSPNPSSPASSIFSTMKTSEHTEGETDELEQAAGNNQKEYLTD
jgi:hypothetical protein